VHLLVKELFDIPQHFHIVNCITWPHCLGRGSATARLLELPDRITPRAWFLSLWMLCVVRYRCLWRADHSSRGVLPSVVCL